MTLHCCVAPPTWTSCSLPTLLASIELETFSPLHCGWENKKKKKKAKWTRLKPIDCEMSSRGTSACRCLIWSGEEAIMDPIAAAAFFMVGMSSVWWHCCRSVVTRSSILMSIDAAAGAEYLLTARLVWIGRLTKTHMCACVCVCTEIQDNKKRNLPDHDMIPLLPLALLGLSAKLLPIRVSLTTYLLCIIIVFVSQPPLSQPLFLFLHLSGNCFASPLAFQRQFWEQLCLDYEGR